MRAGTLERTIVLERSTTTRNATGAAVETWAPVATLRAQVVQIAEEFIRDTGKAAETIMTFRTRYIAASLADRIVYQGRIFDIAQIKEIGRRRGLEIRAVARTA